MDKDDGGGADTAIKQLRVSPSDSQATPTSAGMAEAPQAERVFDRFGCVALVFYAAISVFVFARSLLSDFADSYVGQGPDPSLFMWSLVWWPHAIAHRLNPFRDLRARGLEPRLAHDDSTCKLVGLSDNRRFRASRRLQYFVPGEPATGGLDSLHLVPAHRAQLLAGAFGWIRLWLLRLHGRSDTRGALAHVLVFAVPLAVYLVALWLEGALKSLKFVALMGLTLAVQFTFSVEIFATMIVFGAMAIVLVLAFTDSETRGRIRRMPVPVASSCVFAALLMSPWSLL